MKWLTFAHEGTTGHGYLDGSVIAVTGQGDLAPVVAGDEAIGNEIARLPLDAVRVLAPLHRPGKIIGVAANFQSHVTESGAKEREKSTATPRLFLKPDTTLAGPDAPIELAPITRELDWEVELAVIIGRTAHDVDEDSALSHVFGYATSNDVSARSLVVDSPRDGEAATSFFDWLEGKWLDGSAPIGPYIVTADEIADPQDLTLTLRVNDEIRQTGSTTDMVHTVATLISFSSRLMTLNPGDIILTGTPSGVGATTGDFLSPGDVMVAEVEGLGALRTPVIAPAAGR
ncbi:MAG: fumarylacetoacetate hydrolase family protein [Actinomycetota bacterium]